MRVFLIAFLLCLPLEMPAGQQSGTDAKVETLVGEPAKKIDTFEHPASYPMAAAEARALQAVPHPTGQTLSPAGRSEYELGLTYALLAFTALALVVVAVLAARAAKPWAPDSIIRVFGIVIIIPMAVLLVVAGYSEKQSAPVIGLLGVIAGYLLGHTHRPSGGG